ncbi:signal peptidase I [Candidatus Campbellbacteria bacterium RIFOXYC2_FULL_35_25]|uniref:Signal peptidase I n=1 Tax=Candidatus Campbellbacteria bacterium RIFOXYC2_FULL_35_25 TaxID=1797582 RepID=A0A1F5EH36_9BACT|nr:MAG: signal peptidase I [Candidatus Campbellbacteria bacterium RIFOXYC2_FULL_35_25]
MNKALKIIYYAFITFIGITVVLMLVSVFPITGNFKLLIVQSGSMEPAIKTGSVVIVKPSDNYQIGDVITFGENTKTKTPTTHRIGEVKVVEGNYYYTTKGDANENNDPREVSQTEIIGKVLFDVPFIGYAVATAKEPIGFAVLIVVPAGIVIFDETKKIWTEIRKHKKLS